MGSKSATLISRDLGAKRIRLIASRFRSQQSGVIINWGNSTVPSWYRDNCTFLNKPQAVGVACNKLIALRAMSNQGVCVPEHTIDTAKAQQWLNEGKVVYGRKVLQGHSGRGIIVLEPGTIISADNTCPLYTLATRAKYEYRVHVMNGQVIDFIRKKKRSGVEANPYIRNHGNGWVFAREGVELPNKVKEEAIASVRALGLDFGAVDVGYVVSQDKAYVYEVNTAPGIEGTSLARYVAAFKENYA